MWIVNGSSGGTVTTSSATAMRSGFDPTTLTWTDVRDHFLPKRLKNDPGVVELAFHDRTPRLLKITDREGNGWTFNIKHVALEGADVTARECTVEVLTHPSGVDAELYARDELSLTAALLVVGLATTIHAIPRTERSNPQYKNAHWDDAAMDPPAPPPVLLPVPPPMPDHHPQLLTS